MFDFLALDQFWIFAAQRPFTAWCISWGIWAFAWILSMPFSFAFKAYNRHLRSKNISAHGWPRNPRMDADGDIIYPKEVSRD